jgi:hypothetical protein
MKILKKFRDKLVLKYLNDSLHASHIDNLGYEQLLPIQIQIEAILKAKKKEHFTNYIAKKVASLDVEDHEKTIAQTLATNCLNSCMFEFSFVNTIPATKDNTKWMIDLTIKAGLAAYHELKPFIGFQPMAAPVSLVFHMAYKEIDGDKTFNELDAAPVEGIELGSGLTPTPKRRFALEIISSAIESATKKLQAGWTLEAARTMVSHHGLDIENEMLHAVASELVCEIVNEVLGNITKNAKVSELNGLCVRNMALEKSDQKTDVDDPFDFKGDATKMALEINSVATDIARETRRGCGNFVLASPLDVSLLQTLPTFSPPTDTEFYGSTGIMFAGILNGTIKVYSDIMNCSDQMIIGYKGSNETDTGYIYAPHVPVMSGGVVMNPVTFQPVMSLLTRGGHKLVDPAYYRVIKLAA